MRQAMQPIRQATWFDALRLIFVAAIWGSSFLVISIALTGFGPLTVAALRIALAALLLIILSIAAGESWRFPRRLWLALIVLGVINNVIPFFLISWGQQYVSPAESAILMAVASFITLIVSHFTTDDEKFSVVKLLGLLMGFAGVVTLLGPKLLSGGLGNISLGNIKGHFAVMGAATSYALAAVLARRLSHLPPLATPALMMTIASSYFLPLALYLEPVQWQQVELQPLLAMVYLAVVCTALAFWIRIHILRINGAVFMSQVGYLIPFFGVLWSVLFFHTAVSFNTWLALGFIIIGMLISRRG